MDTTSAVTDGDGLIFHYRAGLYYRQTRSIARPVCDNRATVLVLNTAVAAAATTTISFCLTGQFVLTID